MKRVRPHKDSGVLSHSRGSGSSHGHNLGALVDLIGEKKEVGSLAASRAG